MKEQLIHYVDLLFAGAPEAAEIKQEILQNTLDRYEDLIAQGKSPQAAYSLSISGIGDLSELLSSTPSSSYTSPVNEQIDPVKDKESKIQRAVAIAMYIVCPIPLFILSEFGLETLGLCLMLLLVAAATALIIIAGKNKPNEEESSAHPQQDSPARELRRSIRAVVWCVGICIFFVVSHFTGAWFITWVIIPLTGCVSGLINACLDLKEAE